MNATTLCLRLSAALLLAGCGGDGGSPSSDVTAADTTTAVDTASPADADSSAPGDTAVTGCGTPQPVGGLCNPYPGCTSGCDAGEACTNVHLTGGENVVCQAGADVPVGGLCDNDTGPFCADGACIRNECRQFCDINADCANGTDCRSYQSGNLRVNVCGASEGIICDPFQPDVECSPGTSCYRDVVEKTSSCLATGDGAFGDSCSCAGCCASGLTCTRDDAGAAGICGQNCVTGGAGDRGCASRCAGLVPWRPLHDANTVAFCVPFESYPITPVAVGAAASGELTNVGEYDVFSFDGEAGQVVRVSLTTPGGSFDTNSIDSVVSLHTADDGAVVAIGDDTIFADAFDSTVVTVLPETGRYYVLVRDCWTYSGERPDKEFGCYLPVAKTGKSYTLAVANVTAATTADPEAGDTAATAVPLPFSGSGSSYSPSLARGTFRDASDVDVFRVSVPTNLPTASTAGHTFRAELRIRGFAGGVTGPYGSGATTPLGELRLTTAAAPDTVIARVAPADEDQVISVPVTPGGDYLLWVTPAAGAAPTGDRDFYLLAVLPDRSLPIEGAGHNDGVASAEFPKEVYSDEADTYWQIAGDIAPTAGDEDYYAFAMAAPKRKVSVVCWAAGLGSGVEGLTATLLKEDGTPVSGGAASDSQESAAIIGGILLPTTSTQFFLKVSATGQSPDATATHYDCQVVLSAPAPQQ
ncbi:MAG: hypothetical protein CVU56_15235 [Deltaproteobacteria bacterium HGW-Deltaproteobacteria-14]|jgi:hypothetical protein|nr:MAG: hypothetical protein CVU56_15235 [Deltaproteobacteria bacterium HGW-Deltaproteobacteria-14]